MNRNTITLMLVAAILTVAYIVYFTDWFRSQHILIVPQVRPLRNPRAANPVMPVSFTLDGKYRLTMVKVVKLSDFRTNRFAAPYWHLITKTNSQPVQGLLYGMSVPGMQSKVTKARARPLEPDTVYRLLLDAGKAHGEVDFKTKEALRPR